MKKSSNKYMVLFILGLINFVGNFGQFQMSPIASTIIENLGMSATQYSSVFSAPMTPAVIFSLIVGVIVDKLGIKKPVSLSLILSTVGLILRMFAFSYGMMYLSLFLLGLGTMMATVNGTKLLSNYFAKDKVGIMMGIVLAMASAGQTIGLALGAVFPTIRTGYLFAAVLGVIMTALWIIFVDDDGKKMKEQSEYETQAPPILDCLKVVLKSKYVWIIGFCLMMTVAASIAIASNLPSALAERGMDTVTCGLVSSVYTIGSLVGCIIGPNIVSRFANRRNIILAALAIICALGVWKGWSMPFGVPIIAMMFITGFCIGSISPVLMTIPIQLPEIGPVYAGTAGGVTTTLQLLGPVALVPFVITNLAAGIWSRYFTISAICAVILFFLALTIPTPAKAFGRKKRKAGRTIR